MESANAVYCTCVHELYAAWKINALVTLENPARAWTWAALAHLVTRFGREHSCDAFVDWFFSLQDVSFSMCMHGGQRKKDTRLRSTPGVFEPLQADYDGRHEHVPYGQQWSGGTWTFATSALRRSTLDYYAKEWSGPRPRLFRRPCWRAPGITSAFNPWPLLVNRLSGMHPSFLSLSPSFGRQIVLLRTASCFPVSAARTAVPLACHPPGRL